MKWLRDILDKIAPTFKADGKQMNHKIQGNYLLQRFLQLKHYQKSILSVHLNLGLRLGNQYLHQLLQKQSVDLLPQGQQWLQEYLGYTIHLKRVFQV